MLALFEASDGHPMTPQVTGIAFSLDAECFMAFAQSLPNGIDTPSKLPLQINDVVDFDICWAYNFTDPWGNNFELNCYEYERIKAELIEADSVQPVRYWPSDLYDQYNKLKSLNGDKADAKPPHPRRQDCDPSRRQSTDRKS